VYAVVDVAKLAELYSLLEFLLAKGILYILMEIGQKVTNNTLYIVFFEMFSCR